jgi:hypothetical protein
MPDSQSFRFPNGTLTVNSDGSVVYTYYEDGGGHLIEADLSQSSLGRLLKEVLLERGFLEAFSLRENQGGSLRESALKGLSISASGSSVSAKGNAAGGSLLRQEIKQTLLTAGIPGEEVEFLSTVGRYVQILNTTKNPVKTAQTFRAKDTYPRRFKSWSERRQPKRDSAPAPQPELTCPCGQPAVETGYCSFKCEQGHSKAFQIED